MSIKCSSRFTKLTFLCRLVLLREHFLAILRQKTLIHIMLFHYEVLTMQVFHMYFNPCNQDIITHQSRRYSTKSIDHAKHYIEHYYRLNILHQAVCDWSHIRSSMEVHALIIPRIQIYNGVGQFKFKIQDGIHQKESDVSS